MWIGNILPWSVAPDLATWARQHVPTCQPTPSWHTGVTITSHQRFQALQTQRARETLIKSSSQRREKAIHTATVYIISDRLAREFHETLFLPPASLCSLLHTPRALKLLTKRWGERRARFFSDPHLLLTLWGCTSVSQRVTQVFRRVNPPLDNPPTPTTCSSCSVDSLSPL